MPTTTVVETPNSAEASAAQAWTKRDYRLTGDDFNPAAAPEEEGDGEDEEGQDGGEATGEAEEPEGDPAEPKGEKARQRSFDARIKELTDRATAAEAKALALEGKANLATAFEPIIENFRKGGLQNAEEVQAALTKQQADAVMQARQRELQQEIDSERITVEIATRLYNQEKDLLEMKAKMGRVFKAEFDYTLNTALAKFPLADPDEIKRHATDPSQILPFAESLHNAAAKVEARYKAQQDAATARAEADKLKAVADAAAKKTRGAQAATPNRQGSSGNRTDVMPSGTGDDPTGRNVSWGRAYKESVVQMTKRGKA